MESMTLDMHKKQIIATIHIYKNKEYLSVEFRVQQDAKI
jgi:hypothetical protein